MKNKWEYRSLGPLSFIYSLWYMFVSQIWCLEARTMLAACWKSEVLPVCSSVLGCAVARWGLEAWGGFPFITQSSGSGSKCRRKSCFHSPLYLCFIWRMCCWLSSSWKGCRKEQALLLAGHKSQARSLCLPHGVCHCTNSMSSLRAKEPFPCFLLTAAVSFWKWFSWVLQIGQYLIPGGY